MKIKMYNFVHSYFQDFVHFYIDINTLTPIHERNYGMYNSKMKEEGVSWRLSCNYENSIVIEKLNMYDTASVRGQVAERKIIQLNNLDEIYTSSDLKTMYLVPGERLK